VLLRKEVGVSGVCQDQALVDRLAEDDRTSTMTQRVPCRRLSLSSPQSFADLSFVRPEGRESAGVVDIKSIEFALVQRAEPHSALLSACGCAWHLLLYQGVPYNSHLIGNPPQRVTAIPRYTSLPRTAAALSEGHESKGDLLRRRPKLFADLHKRAVDGHCGRQSFDLRRRSDGCRITQMWNRPGRKQVDLP
jgi:hypothetical protein